ncbi:ribonuclease Y [Oceanispirochaeta crateris]|uniref:Ribonuclease Y n=1 Tax=Oceanispirochaeta crateris TaxID=2518645 RepID=A0A5C1QMI3_9SPIO|nr:ribonuclease Y [Oceanispirochaeta crateris]QEN08538.1 ribonuclease Y [Oceanispirochaeta crateris]
MDLVYKIALPLVGIVIGWTIRWLYARYQLSSSEQKSLRVKQDAVKEAEQEKKSILLEAQNQIMKERRQLEKENRDRRNDVQKYERRVQQKEDNLDNKTAMLERNQALLNEQEAILANREEKVAEEEVRWQTELERISGLTKDEAKKLIIQSLENEAKHDAQALINKIEQEANLTAEKKARDVIVTTIQRLATDVSTEITVTSVSLPNDEMKGRIIGREGRNIRTLETLTGVDIIIDDTPEAVVISCFDPIRKVIAKIALERLIADGRIHPARIEEVVQKVTKEISQTIYEEGEKVLFDLGIHNVRPEGIRALGRLHFRTSYGQNVLSHSKEVAVIAGMIAAEIGADAEIAKRGALLHDIGKGLETDGDVNHAELGAELCKRMNEDPRIVNAVAAHHNDVEINSVEGILVQVADAISAARPGARRETLDNYIKRLENLEKIAMSFEGVEKVFAIQAGRELRIMVNNDKIDDSKAQILAKDIAKQIENELKYPGRIRVTIIRETRAVEYAR